MTEEEALHALRSKISYWYSQKDMAKEAGLSSAYVSAVLKGHKSPSSKLLSLIGLEKKVSVKVVRTVENKYSSTS